MLYRDLFQFQPIETVIQLSSADEKDRARDLVSTYVISERMAQQLTDLVLPQLQFLSPEDNRGVLIVGNYGTGKSHLMALLSAVAEHSDLAEVIENEKVREAAKAIAGRFKVVRVEIGSVTRSLRDILLDELGAALNAWGAPFAFPPADQVANNKDPIIQAIATFQERYPDTGILLVVDELLDYLRTREERQLILDLGFLRELGEVSAVTQFRFLGGVQETLFDSPRFAFVADQLRRVRDRFEQVRIVREDIAYVVSHRLLLKTDRQLAWISEHLRQFAPLYQHMAERIEEFAQLFPIHPAYIETFQSIYVAEKREVLRTISQAMRGLLDQEVPADSPGLLSYDHYWNVLRDNPSLRSVPEVAAVIDKSNVLEGRIRNAYGRQHLRPLAMRTVQALSVQRLTTGSIDAALGVTAEELRDDLCLYLDLPERTAEFLLDQVQVALREIVRAVSGQFISYNESNGQYYLDLKKDVDFDARIAERGEMMGHDELNRYFFDALRFVFSLSDTTYVTNNRIWFYELPWSEHRVTRPGYLYFGVPDERSTAQPPRDFYIYVLPPFLDRDWHDEQLSDEVIFQLSGLDQAFISLLQAYGGARALSAESATHRQVYAERAESHFRRVSGWFRENTLKHLQVRHQGVAQPVREILAQLRTTASQSVEELVRLVSSHLLETEFAERYPDYPVFASLREPVSEDARSANAMEAVRALAGRTRTALAAAVLEGLELLDSEGKVRPLESRYARRFLERLQAKPEGQVLSRSELIEHVAAEVRPIEKEVEFRLEPEWVTVVLLALVHSGDIELSLPDGQALDAGIMERAATMDMSSLSRFRFCKPPRDLPVSLWVTVFEGLGLRPGLVRDPNAREEGVRELQKLVGAETERLARLESDLTRGPKLWNQPIFTDAHTLTMEAGVIQGSDQPSVTLSSLDFLPYVRDYKRLLESLSAFTTVGKLRNLKANVLDVKEALEARIIANRAEAILELTRQLQPLTSYLAEAQANLPDGHPWSDQAAALRTDLLDGVRRHGKGEEGSNLPALRRELEALKAEYVTAYAREHGRLVLGPQADERRAQLYLDHRLAALDALSAIELLNRQDLELWKRAVQDLPTCRSFHEGAIADAPTCPFCHLRPSQRLGAGNAEETLHHLDGKLDRILADWRRALQENLKSDRSQQSLQAMSSEERQPIEAFLAQPENATDIPRGFVESANQALRGLQVVALSGPDLLRHLRDGGLPCTQEELRRRFLESVRDAMSGHDPQTTRLTLEQ